jgi:hypothetical protein
MKITQQQFDELKEQTDLAAVLRAVGVEVKDEAWPKCGHAYFYVDHFGIISSAIWMGSRSDLYLQSLNNVHRTRKDAENYKATTIRRWQAECAIRNWRDKHCPFEEDWKKRGHRKWCNDFNYENNKWRTTYFTYTLLIGQIQFATEADAKACLEALPDEWEVLRTVGG